MPHGYKGLCALRIRGLPYERPACHQEIPNRRLYDTVESRYITLDDVRRLVLERIEFCVIDKRSQQDITRPVLLQVIADQEQRTAPS